MPIDESNPCLSHAPPRSLAVSRWPPMIASPAMQKRAVEPVSAEPEDPKEAAAIGAVQDAQSEAASPHVPEGQGASQEEVASLKAGGADEPSIIREPEHVAEEVAPRVWLHASRDPGWLCGASQPDSGCEAPPSGVWLVACWAV